MEAAQCTGLCNSVVVSSRYIYVQVFAVGKYVGRSNWAVSETCRIKDCLVNKHCYGLQCRLLLHTLKERKLLKMCLQIVIQRFRRIKEIRFQRSRITGFLVFTWVDGPGSEEDFKVFTVRVWKYAPYSLILTGDL